MLTVYKASAGSGKTYNLALKYITILLGIKLNEPGGEGRYVLNSKKYAPGGRRFANRHAGILAITFTNKATAEMKERIVRQLEALSHEPVRGKDTPYGDVLTKLYGCDRTELAETAGLALKELLCDYSQFNVSTIDSFFQTVLRTFAREVNHQGDYEVEINDKDAVEAGIGMMLDEINFGNNPRGKKMLRWIDTIVAKNIVDGKKFNVFNSKSSLRKDLRKFVEYMCGEPFRMCHDRMEEYLASDKVTRLASAIADILQKDISVKERDLAAKMRKAFSEYGVEYEWTQFKFDSLLLRLENGEEIVDSMAGLGKNASKRFCQWLEWTPETDRAPFYVKKNLPKIGKNEVYPSEAFDSEAHKFAVELHALYLKKMILEKVLEGCYNLEFLGFASDFINKYRRENNMILLSDTNELLHRIIKEDELSFVYERLGLRLTNLLIDEFQDTSRMQWKNLKPLVANSISGGHDSLIIGDVKQAIYRFRNSDSYMLDRGVENVDFPRNHVTLGLRPEENCNFRSSHTIVKFNNTLFRALAEVDEINGYEGVTQDLPKATENIPGYVRLDFYKNSPKSEDLPSLKAMADDIFRQHESGYSWRDIAILVRSREDGIDVVNYLLSNHPQIPVISDESLLLDKARSVRIILSMLRIIDRAYAFSGVSEEVTETRKFSSIDEVSDMISRYNYYLGRGTDPERALRKAVDDSIGEGERIRSEAFEVIRNRPANPTALVETIIAIFLDENIRKDEYAFISAFQDVLENYFASHPTTIRKFLDWWNLNRDKISLSSSSNVDAVSVMTIHKSKGLQWPCVHIPICSWSMFKPNERLWYDITSVIDGYLPKCAELTPPMLLLASNSYFSETPLAEQYDEDVKKQIADNLNTTYVAFTRAVNELIVSCAVSTSSTGHTYIGVGDNISKALDLIDSESFGMNDKCECKISGKTNLEEGFLFSRYEIGRYTSAQNEQVEKVTTLTCGAETDSNLSYDVVLRNDTRELVAVNDALTETLIVIGGEEVKTEDSPLWKERLDGAAEWGNLVHAVLGGMRRFNDLEMSLKSVSRLYRLSSEESSGLRKMLEESFEKCPEEIARWFDLSKKIYFERDIYDPEADEMLRPDRVVFLDDGDIEIVDYKTSTTEKASYRKQVSRYVEIFKELYPEKRIRGYIWYLRLGKIVEL